MIKTNLRRARAALLALPFCALTPPPLLANAPDTQPTTRQAREAVDRDEQQAELLGQRRKDLLSQVRARMDESAARLAREADPGRITQEIQRRIITDIDALIDVLPKDPPPPNDPKGDGPHIPADPGKSQQDAAPQPADAASTTAAAKSAASTAAAHKPAPADIRELTEAFMRVAPRDVRGAVIEGATEYVPPKYKRLTEDYYRSIARGDAARH